MPITRSGLTFSTEELRRLYEYNKQHGLLPVAGYFCPVCDHELASVESVCDNPSCPQSVER